MKAVICTKYGPPEVLQLRDVPKPVPKANEVLIKVHATTCHIGDTKIRGFQDIPTWQKIPFRLYLGITKPKRAILGMELAGTIEENGKDAKRFKPGDAVYASAGFVFGAYAEYICLPENAPHVKYGLVAPKPKNMNFEEAAAGATTGGVTVMEVLRKTTIQKGQKVLIYGASGSVGIFALQLAKHYGADVTAVCSTDNLEWVKSLGADQMLDYTKQDFTTHSEKYEIIFDAVDKLSASHCKNTLTPNGKYRNVTKDSGSGNGISTKDLFFLTELIEAGKIKTYIDRQYPLEQIAEAHRYVEKGHKKGHVVINVLDTEN